MDIFDLPTTDDHGATVLGHWDVLAGKAGWTTVSSGLYLLTSPEGLSCWCKIWYAGSSRLNVQFSSVGGSNPGFVHPLKYRAEGSPNFNPSLLLWMNCCSVFTGVPSKPTTGSCYQYAVQGGVIATKAPSGSCTDPAHPLPIATEAWFSTSDSYSLLGTGGSSGMRGSIYRQQYGSYSGCFNGVLNNTAFTSSAGPGALSMVVPIVPEYRTADAYLHKGLFKYGDPATKPALADAIIAWGDTDAGHCQVRGALFDCVCSTAPYYPIEQIWPFGFDGSGQPIKWMSYNNSQADSYAARNTLFLKFPSPITPENIAY
jgi:hypothetical protein